MAGDRASGDLGRVRIAAVCAPQPNHNPGMQSVDLALQAFARRNPDLDIHPYRLPVVDPDDLDPSLQYADLIEHWDEVCGSDRILYWGDFHQMRSYIREIDQRRAARSSDRRLYEDFPTSHYLLLDRVDPEVRRRAVGFGGTLLHNSSQDYAQRDYREALRTLLVDGRAWWFRDPYSATQAAALTGEYDKTFLGTDASLLLSLDATMLSTTRPPPTPPTQVGIYLGRGYRSYARRYSFARELADLLDLKPIWIPWMPDRGALRSRRFRARHPIQSRRWSNNRQTLAALLSQVSKCAVVVTDTYHLAVNAWRSGIPAICIGHATSPQSLDVSAGQRFEWRDKRHVFYSMYGLQGLYVHESELASRDQRRARLHQLRNRLEESAYDIELFQSRTEREREYFSARLVDALTN